MRMFTARVANGAIVVDDELEGLPDGTQVTVVVEDEEEIVLSPEDEAALLASIEAADRGEVVSFEEVLRDVDAMLLAAKK